MRPAVYFPVTTTPLLMRAGLQPFGTDFGNGERDGHFFQLDDEAERYRAAKQAVVDDRHLVSADTAEHRAVHEAALAFVAQRLRAEHNITLAGTASDDVERRWHEVCALVQEDIAVLHRGTDDDGDVVMLNVCFPSGWRPELLRRSSFTAIHGPVPDFAKNPLASRSMVRGMVERGPYVRFVWTVSADDHLDHHPDHGRRAVFDDVMSPHQLWLRIERQTTVPLADVGGSLFLIRTYLRPFPSLDDDERRTLREALLAMPAEIAAYKGLARGQAIAAAVLADM
jgi:hypothetical protein